MRDPNRIYPYCNEIAELWMRQPDMRFAQFMMNILGEVRAKSGGCDPFYMGDKDFMELVKDIEWLKEKDN